MNKAKVIFVGGFLGAGKTTLLWETAKRISITGKTVGLITNDQAPDLVDTALLQRDKVKVEEVSGSCFCCNFNGLTHSLSNLTDIETVDVIIAEPVGSCTDLSATLLQPLKEKFNTQLTLSPLSVLISPQRLADLIKGENGDLHPSAAYIIKKQVEEADMILISKSDTVSPEELNDLKRSAFAVFPNVEILEISSLSGDGLDTWIDTVLTRTDAGLKIAEVDYDTYAEGEAVLGWLNGTVKLQGENVDWSKFLHTLLSSLSEQFDEMKASVGHVKAIIEDANSFVIGNITGKRATLTIKGTSPESNSPTLTLNARVEISHEILESIVRDTVKRCSENIRHEIVTLRSLKPGRPNPTFRYDRVVKII